MNDDAFLVKVRAIVFTELDNINVSRLAEKFKYHPAHLYRKMEAAADCSPSDFIKQIRMEESKALLKNTDLLVKDIGYKIGYSTPSSFVEAFRKYYGVTPDTYRKE